jgi:regulator of sigma E protease
MSAILTVIISVLTFIVSISILIGVHEFGHFWVARRFGIKVLRFSIGFGKPLFSWYDKWGTEYVLSAIPLGGYVSLLGERGTVVTPVERPLAYSEKPVGVRMAVLLAGPLFNLLFAILAFWLVFFSGISVMAPILGDVEKGSPAFVAGLKSGQEIVSVEGQSTPTWDSVKIALLRHLGEEKVLAIASKAPNAATPEKHILDISHLRFLHNKKEVDFLEELGLVPLDPFPAVVGGLRSGLPAEEAGIKVGDRIIGVDGRPMSSRSALSHYIQAKTGVWIKLSVLRDQKTLVIPVRPIAHDLEDGKTVGFIGIEYEMPDELPKEFVRVERYGVWDSLVMAYTRTQDYTLLSLQMIKKMIVGVVSPKHLSGPIAIAQYAGQSVSFGFEYFLSFLAVISISLGVFNLLPIPILDGGHLAYCIIEIIIGRPVSERFQMIGLWIGGVFLIGVTLLAFYNDIVRF